MHKLENNYSTVKQCYKQHVPWSCSVACVRTLLSTYGVEIDEPALLLKHNIKETVATSRDILNWGLIPNYTENKMTCGSIAPISGDPYLALSNLMTENNVMVKCNIGHYRWFVVLAFIHLGNNNAMSVVLYDPRSDKVCQLSVVDFFDSWSWGGNTGCTYDYVAIGK